MKAIILIVLILLGCSSPNRINQKYVSAATKINFNKTYPNAKDVDWEKHKNKYKAVFKRENLLVTITLDPSGNVLQTENQILTSELPQKIKSYFFTNYEKQKIIKAFKVTDKTENLTTFRLQTKKLVLVFDENGNFLKELKEK
ncbi:hypothetical protein IT568_07700 [bacterium]|nr:hypothetical protein [bacterium]